MQLLLFFIYVTCHGIRAVALEYLSTSSFIYCNFSLKYLDAVLVGAKRLGSFIPKVTVVYSITNINYFGCV